MYGLMSLTFCKRVCVMARSWDRAGHVAVLCGRGVVLRLAVPRGEASQGTKERGALRLPLWQETDCAAA